jgi:hypothetical protein
MSRTLPNHPASKCHPFVPPASVLPEVGVGGVVVGVVGGVAVGVIGGVVVGPMGDDELLVAGAEGDTLVDGADFFGFGDPLPLDVGLAEPVMVGAPDALFRLVPRSPLSVAVVGTAAVAGTPGVLAD